MCLAAVLGLGACGGTGNGSKANIILTEPPVSGSVIVPEEIKEQELNKNEFLYIYTENDNCFKIGYIGDNYYVWYENNFFQKTSYEVNTLRSDNVYYTIGEHDYKIVIRNPNEKSDRKVFTFVGSNVQYCVASV